MVVLRALPAEPDRQKGKAQIDPYVMAYRSQQSILEARTNVENKKMQINRRRPQGTISEQLLSRRAAY